MEFKSTSRKDDMQAIFYNLLYMLGGFTFPEFSDKFGEINDNHNSKDKFKKILKYKKLFSLS